MSAIAHATITTEAGHTWWICPNCKLKLGEVIGQRVVIVIGERRITMTVRNDQDQTCPRCGAASVLEARAIAA